MASQLNTHTAFVVVDICIHSTKFGELITACNASFIKSTALFWLYRHPHSHGRLVYRCIKFKNHVQ